MGFLTNGATVPVQRDLLFVALDCQPMELCTCEVCEDFKRVFSPGAKMKAI